VIAGAIRQLTASPKPPPIRWITPLRLPPASIASTVFWIASQTRKSDGSRFLSAISSPVISRAVSAPSAVRSAESTSRERSPWPNQEVLRPFGLLGLMV